MAQHLPNPEHKRELFPGWVVFALFLAIFLVCYFSLYVNDFAFHDDYPDFFFGEEGTHIAQRTVEGRPLFAFISYLFVALASDIEDLRWIRLIGIAGVTLLAWSLYLALIRAGHHRFQSYCLALIVGASLPIQVYTAWACTAPFSLAAAISGLSFLLADRTFDERLRSRRRIVRGGGGNPVPADLSRHLSACGHVLLGVRRHPFVGARRGYSFGHPFPLRLVLRDLLGWHGSRFRPLQAFPLRLPGLPFFPCGHGWN